MYSKMLSSWRNRSAFGGLEYDSDVALSEQDRTWVKDRINEAFGARQNSRRTFLKTIQDWGGLGSVVVVIGAAIGAWVKIEKFETNIIDRLGDLETSVNNLKLLSYADSPRSKNSQVEVLDALADAKKSNKPLPLQTVQQAGIKFVRSAVDSEGSWKVALQLADYQSGLIELPKIFPEASNAKQLDNSFSLRIKLNTEPGYRLPQFSWVNEVSFADGVRIGPIGSNYDNNVALPQWLIGYGGSIILDGIELRNIVLVGTRVSYSAQRTILTNVLFVSCVFVFVNGQSSRDLTETILASGDSRMNFSSNG